MSYLHFLPSVLFIPPTLHTSPGLFYLQSVLLFHLQFFTFLVCVLSFSLAICFYSFCFYLFHAFTFSLFCLPYNSSFGAFTSSSFSTFSVVFLLFFFFFTPLSRAACLSLQDGAVHPWPGLWGHSEKADPKAEGAHTEVYRYGSERTHLHHTKV